MITSCSGGPPPGLSLFVLTHYEPNRTTDYSWQEELGEMDARFSHCHSWAGSIL